MTSADSKLPVRLIENQPRSGPRPIIEPAPLARSSTIGKPAQFPGAPSASRLSISLIDCRVTPAARAMSTCEHVLAASAIASRYDFSA